MNQSWLLLMAPALILLGGMGLAGGLFAYELARDARLRRPPTEEAGGPLGLDHRVA